MNSSFIIFCASVILFLIALGWNLRDILQRLIRRAADLVPVYGMAYLKAGLGALIAFGICFKATWQPITMAETLKWAWWDWTIHFGEPLLAMLMYLQGFLDRSLEKADAVKADKEGVQPLVHSSPTPPETTTSP